jgi:hypothetical protein
MPVDSTTSSYPGYGADIEEEEIPSYAASTSRQPGPSSSSQTPTADISFRQLGVADAYNQQPPSYRAAQVSAADQNQPGQLNRTPSAQHTRDHVLRKAVGSGRGLDKIREKINKGGDPAAQSSNNQHNAFHKAALALEPNVDAVDVLKAALGQDRLRDALNARDKSGQKPADLAAERAAKAGNTNERREFEAMTYRLGPAAVQGTDRQ